MPGAGGPAACRAEDVVRPSRCLTFVWQIDPCGHTNVRQRRGPVHDGPATRRRRRCTG
ncbi:hypothetical protein NOCARDAX2BIS_140060 [Nocardioides sp. AX2bis]|nr:hypothetical protein NOCARDAX2BIS_140060 [Nocardioides sp. AX2bis]